MKLNIDNLNLVKKKLELSNKLGIKNIIIEFDKDVKSLPKRVIDLLEKENSFNFFYRVNLKLENLKDFKESINQFNNYPYIVSVESANKDLQIYAARDSRVDIISFSEINILKTLSEGIISLTKQNESFVEFSLNPIMKDNKIEQSKNFRKLYKHLHRSINQKANIIISGNFSELHHLRHPRSLISICNTLLEIPLSQSKYFFTESVQKLLNRVEKRRLKSLIEDRVKLIPRD
ncbi:MAG: RNase P subunit p30 family protein [Candidatus Lokiarchaeota archaeon]